MQKKILITGAAGFIGSHLCDFFIEKKFKVVGIDNLLTGNINNINQLLGNRNFSFYEMDVCNKIDLKKEFDYILHFASPASPFDYLKYPLETLRTGAIGTENVLNFGLENNAVTLVASTSEVYGDPLKHPQKEDYFGNVNPVGPRSVYDESKRFLESMTITYSRKFKLDVRIVRIFNTYGPRMNVNDGRVIPTFINQVLTQKNFSVFGNGKQTRSFCYIDDTINGIYKLLNSNFQNPINIGNPEEFTIIELIEILNSIYPNKCKVSFKKLPENDPKKRRPDITLAKKILNWNPKIDLKSGLKKTIEYYMTNKLF